MTTDHGTSLPFHQAIEAAQELISHLLRGRHTWYDIDNPDHYAILCRCAVLIDQCFLAGQLTQVERYPNHDGMWHLKIHVWGRNVRCESLSSNFSVEFDTGGANLPPCVRINLAAGQPYTIFAMVEHLMHEMVHGILRLFVDNVSLYTIMFSSINWLASGTLGIAALLLVYLIRVNQLLKGVPIEFRKFPGQPWTSEILRKTYRQLDEQPIDYTHKLPPRLKRRYLITGGNGLVGGFIVLQLLARGTPPKSIRIVDIRKSERNDMNIGLASEVEFIKTDITSSAAVKAAFEKPWDATVAYLPLTVFHTAAVILASDRSKYLYPFPEAVNVKGTENVLAAAKAAGADVFSSTSSASIGIRRVDPFVFWAEQPTNFWQLLDERDFAQPLKPREEFFGNYPASKATAERIVCAANCESFRTGTIRPANGVYGNPTDNTVGDPLSKSIFPTWVPHIVQSFVHAANVAVAHLHHEASLVSGGSDSPQAGRPFVVTDPNPPISYDDLYRAISTLSIHPFRVIVLPPVLVLLLSHIFEWYFLLPYRFPALGRILPRLKGDIRHLQPGLFSICTHLIGIDKDARKPVSQGGLGYEGVLTTMQGMSLEILEWNREHQRLPKDQKKRKLYTTSISLADQLRQVLAIDNTDDT
ncbi:3-beta hydroxysteroid dehydrogenase/isomerase family [Colletotrichum plurivorum]|uniref:3-beta hydroxysteroid dehydrogenase/isomerase family n=1 Tax=Colletotrichum plurivorum TaxID=2175906 RepID=A0A8H6NMU3_9PEZI|nr:3-beta hydroxysteroid dehydrogenase/isomerase family [Colletotrichum plurivorum]